MAQKPLDPAGGEARVVSTRILRDQHERVVAAISQRDLTLAEFLRKAAENELERIEAELEAAAPPGSAA